MRKIIGVLFLLSGCNTITPAQQTTLISTTATLASVASANNTTVAKLVSDGQLFCSGASGLFAVAGVFVKGLPSATVATACSAIDNIAVPVSPPSIADNIPIK